MMNMYYETERLVLRILHESSAQEVLEFYLRNKDIFEIWEPDRPANFYTLSYQSSLLECEFQRAAKMTGVRFWIFPKNQPELVIGTVSFQNVLRSVYQSCSIGYKLDEAYWHQGYAREALSGITPIIFEELNLHRIEALVHPDNGASIRLLESLGFEQEGICRSCVFLHSGWADHLRYSLINPH